MIERGLGGRGIDFFFLFLSFGGFNMRLVAFEN